MRTWPCASSSLCRAALRKQLGVEPEAQTNSLEAALQLREGAKHRPASAIDIASQQAAIPAPMKQDDRPSVAVLPFQNLSGDAEQEYFADGIVEDIITALARSPPPDRHRPKFELHL